MILDLRRQRWYALFKGVVNMMRSNEKLQIIVAGLIIGWRKLSGEAGGMLCYGGYESFDRNGFKVRSWDSI